MSGTHIVFFSHHFPTPDQPGAARPWEFADALAAGGHSVTVVASAAHYMQSEFDSDADGLWSKQSVDEFELVRVRSVGQYRGGLAMRLCDYALYSVLAFVYAVTDRDIDTVVTGTPPPFHLPVIYFFAVAAGARFVLDVRDLYPETAVALGLIKRRSIEWVYQQYEQWIWRRADALVVPSEPMVDTLCEAGVSRDRINVVHNAYNSATIDPDGSEVAVPKWDDEFVVAYTGGMGYAPDILTVLDAAARVRDQDIRFVFLGDGERKAEYQRRCERQGLDNCTFLQPVPRREVGAYIDRADACVHALPDEDVWELALPNKVFEYMRHGKPVVFAGYGATAELLENVGCGIAVPPGDDAALADAIERLSIKTELTVSMAATAEAYMFEAHPHQRLVDTVGSVVT